jgi:adenosylmethionine-8-amino-7-oxononanoate transaminase
MHPLAELDRLYVWHPFTQMRDWLRREPLVIVSGQGAVLRDACGREYLDANSSIWTNLHGHRCPPIDRAIRDQLRRIAHSSALGLANEPAARLAERLVKAVNPPLRAGAKGPALAKVFYSDDGSTAMEVALKLAYQFARRTRGLKKPVFLSLANAYHGDTVGAVSLGHIDLFHRDYGGLTFRSRVAAAPYCYRCAHNRAKPERADAREYRRCRWECISKLERRFAVAGKRGQPIAALVVEPLMQGAAGMIAQPTGWLRQAADIARQYGAQLIVDEVLTGFGRATSALEGSSVEGSAASLFACHQEGVQPDFLALGKGFTGGYLPMAATLTTTEVFEAFLGEYAEFKTFFHGHSYTANQLGAAAALASLQLLTKPGASHRRSWLADQLRQALQGLWSLPVVGDVRQIGLIAGIELVRHWRDRQPFDLPERAGLRVCEAMVKRGVITRPIGNVVVLMPPYCTTAHQLKRMVETLYVAIEETLEPRA